MKKDVEYSLREKTIVTPSREASWLAHVRKVGKQSLIIGERILTPEQIATLAIGRAGLCLHTDEASLGGVVRWIILSKPELFEMELAEAAEMPSTTKIVAETISFLEKSGLTLKNWNDWISRIGTKTPGFALAKKKTLANIWKSLEEARKKLGLVSSETLFLEATRTLETFPANKLNISFEGIFDPSHCERLFLERLAEQAGQKIAFWNPSETMIRDFSKVQVFSVATRENEITDAFALITKLLQTKTLPHEIALILADRNELSQVLTVARQAGIPIDLRCARPISLSPAGQLIDSILQGLSEGFRLGLVKDILQNSEMFLSDKEKTKVSRYRVLKALAKVGYFAQIKEGLGRAEKMAKMAIDEEKSVLSALVNGLHTIDKLDEQSKKTKSLGDMRNILLSSLIGEQSKDGFSAISSCLFETIIFDDLRANRENSIEFWKEYLSNLSYTPRDSIDHGVRIETLGMQPTPLKYGFFVGFTSEFVPRTVREFPFLLDFELGDLATKLKVKDIRPSKVRALQSLDMLERRIAEVEEATILVPKFSFGEKGLLPKAPIVSKLGVPAGMFRKGEIQPWSRGASKTEDPKTHSFGYKHILAEASLEDLKAFGPYEGEINDDSVKDCLLTASASSLSGFIWCPYQFYMEKLVKLKTTEFPEVAIEEEWPAVRDYGTMHHKALALIFDPELKKDPTENDVLICIEAAIDKIALESPPPSETIRKKISDTVLRNVLAYAEAQKKKLEEQGWEVVDCELPFGGCKYGKKGAAGIHMKGPVSISIGGRIHLLNGTIDRVDVKANQTGKVKEARIIDYKSGKTDKWKDLEPLYSNYIQLILYALALEEGSGGKFVVTSFELHSPLAETRFAVGNALPFGRPGSPERTTALAKVESVLLPLSKFAESSVFPRRAKPNWCKNNCGFAACCPNISLIAARSSLKMKNDNRFQ